MEALNSNNQAISKTQFFSITSIGETFIAPVVAPQAFTEGPFTVVIPLFTISNQDCLNTSPPVYSIQELLISRIDRSGALIETTNDPS